MTTPSNFAKHALPEVPLEELVQLRLAVGLYKEVLTRTALGYAEESLPLVARMDKEIHAECDRRLRGLSHLDPHADEKASEP